MTAPADDVRGVRRGRRRVLRRPARRQQQGVLDRPPRRSTRATSWRRCGRCSPSSSPSSAPGKIFRPYRDVRFSRDKTPYKTACGAIAGPFYVQVSADGLLVAGGQYRWAPGPARPLPHRRRRRPPRPRPRGPHRGRHGHGRGRGAAHPGRRAPRHPARAGSPPTTRGWSCCATAASTPTAAWAPDDVLHEAATAERVAAVWRATRPLTDWLDDHVGAPEHSR